MDGFIQPGELVFFSVLAASRSLGAAARELGVTTAAVSKRLAQIEGRLGVLLVNRTTRRMSLTPEGAICVEHARRVLDEIDELQQRLRRSRGAPSGLLRVHATPGFGRRHVAPAVSEFVRRHPQAEVRLTLAAEPPSLDDDAFDVSIRFGTPPDARVVARLIARNRRVLVASPEYLARNGVPRVPADLEQHNCITIRQGDQAHGVWRLTARAGARRREEESVRTRGSLGSNDGEVALAWALEGHGILMRAEWDVARHLASGTLALVLPQYHTPDADIYAVHAQRQRQSPRVRAFVDLLAQSCRVARPAGSARLAPSRAGGVHWPTDRRLRGDDASLAVRREASPLAHGQAGIKLDPRLRGDDAFVPCAAKTLPLAPGYTTTLDPRLRCAQRG